MRMKGSGWILSSEVPVVLARQRVDVWKANLCDISLKHLSAMVLSEDEERRASLAERREVSLLHAVINDGNGSDLTVLR